MRIFSILEACSRQKNAATHAESRRYRQASSNALEAGFDGVEIHGAFSLIFLSHAAGVRGNGRFILLIASFSQ